MATEVRTFAARFPVTGINDDIGAGATALAGGQGPVGYQLVLVDTNMIDPVAAKALASGWDDLGAGDQRPARPTITQTYASTGTTIEAADPFTPPTINPNYSIEEVNDLASRCAALEAEIVALRSRDTDILRVLNTLVDVLQTHGFLG